SSNSLHTGWFICHWVCIDVCERWVKRHFSRDLRRRHPTSGYVLRRGSFPSGDGNCSVVRSVCRTLLLVPENVRPVYESVARKGSLLGHLYRRLLCIFPNAHYWSRGPDAPHLRSDSVHVPGATAARSRVHYDIGVHFKS